MSFKIVKFSNRPSVFFPSNLLYAILPFCHCIDVYENAGVWRVLEKIHLWGTQKLLVASPLVTFFPTSDFSSHFPFILMKSWRRSDTLKFQFLFVLKGTQLIQRINSQHFRKTHICLPKFPKY
jgi:hypothetical protein